MPNEEGARLQRLDPESAGVEGDEEAPASITIVLTAANDCLTPELLEEGWVLTCQSRCVSPNIRIEYPD
jgi:hypothetical protein